MSDILCVIKGDMTNIVADAVVRVANSKQGDALLAAGGKKMRIAVDNIGSLQAGQVAMTLGFDLPSRHVIHTKWPVWQEGASFETNILYASYINAMHLATEMDLETIVFPDFGGASRMHPQALRVSMSAVTAFFDAPWGTLRQVIFCVDDVEKELLYRESFERFYRRTLYMPGEVDMGDVDQRDELYRIVTENPGISVDEINEILKKLREEAGRNQSKQ